MRHGFHPRISLMLAPLNGATSRVRAHVMRAAISVALATIPAFAQSPSSIPAPRTASLGICRLSTGATIQPCTVTYRTFGPLSAARDNVVLIPTYFAGRSEDHFFMLGTYVDTTRYHVVIVDALADGSSASPSNTRAGRSAFEGLTIGDMIDVQHRFLSEHLGLPGVRAVVGISMGGFQALEWAVRYPTFMDAAVPIVATPRPTAYDRLIYDTWRRSAEALDLPSVDIDSAWMQASRLEALFMKTPRSVNDAGDAALARSVHEMAAAYRTAAWSLADYAAQLRAVASHDVSARFGGDMARAAAAVKARLLLVWSPDDMLVDPRPAEAFARLAGAETFAVPSPCGHAVYSCEADRIGQHVRAFIARDPSTALPSSSSRQSHVHRSP
jgi:homoserine O-acetyltransferase/O-succinyltransferase